MNPNARSGPILKIKQAAKSLLEAIENAKPEGKMKLQLGILLAPQEGMSLDEVRTAINKYVQALGCFKDEHVASMTMEWVLENPLEEIVIADAQSRLATKVKLAGVVNNVEAKTAIAQDTKVQNKP